MSKRKLIWLGAIGLLAGLLLVLAGCAGPTGSDGPAGPAGLAGAAGPVGATGPAGGDTCSECHNDTTLIASKSAQAALTVHQTGRGWHYAGPRADCTNCHSSEGFVEMVAKGKSVEDGEDIADASPPNCRTCHQIHETYTGADWALRTTAPVTLLASGETFDMGDGNLCANCHQPRREMAVENGMVNVSSTHWGPHHGPQSTVLLGIGGALVDGSPSIHYTIVEDGCPQCHLVDGNHLFSPSLDRGAIKSCQACHADAANFDIHGVQTEVDNLIAELEGLLVDKGLLAIAEHEPWHEGPPEVHPVVGEYPEAEAGALWNYIMLQIEDGSHGVHNPPYTIALLKASIAALE